MEHAELAAAAVHRFVSGRVDNSADAADISQDTLTIGCARRSTFANEATDNCLFAIARTLIAEYERGRGQVDFVPIDRVIDDQREAALQISAASVVATCHFDNWLRRCDQVLEPGQHVALLLVDIYGYALKDSAAALGMTASSFKMLLYTARRRMKAVGPIKAIRRLRIGVACHLDSASLGRLREQLIDGVRLAV